MATLQELMDKITELDKTADYKSIGALLTDDVLLVNNDAKLYTCKALACNMSQDSANAYKYAQEAIRLAPDNTYGYLQRGISFFYAGDFKNAVTDFNTVLDTDKQNLEAFFHRANTWYQLQQYEKAIDDYTRALEFDLNKNNPLIYYDRGLAKNALSEYVSAIKDFDKAISLSPEDNYYQAYCDRGVSNFMLGYYDKAREDYNKSLQINEGYYLGHYNSGLLYHKQQLFEDALKDYDRAIEIEKNFAPAYNNEGQIYLNSRDYDKATLNFNKAIALDPGLAVGYLNRGIVSNLNFKYDEALADFIKARDLFDPKIKTVEKYLAFIEDSIKLIEEKFADKKRIESIKAAPEDKEAKAAIERKIDLIIKRVRDAAKSDVTAVVHYTKLFVAEIFVKSTEAKMHYSNSIYMNDPTEGSVLFEFLNDPVITDTYKKGEKASESSIYLGSFLPAEDKKNNTEHVDELLMWRTYGKDENGREGAGSSIIINSAFFKAQNSILPDMAEDPSNSLLNVIYVKKHLDQKTLQIDADSDINKALDEIKVELNALIQLKAHKDAEELFRTEIDKSVYKRLSGISYLFKSSDYEYEHEARIIKYIARNSDNIKFIAQTEAGKPSKRFYIESLNDVLPHIEEIYLGPTVENHQQWSLYFDYEIRQRDKDIKAMTTAPFALNPGSVKILKSETKFQ